MPDLHDPLVPGILWYSCDGMMVIDEHRRILTMNPTLERLTGRTSQEVAGKVECGLLLACRDLQGCPLADCPQECPGLKAIQKFKPVEAAEYTIQDAHGKGIVVSTSYTPIQLPGRPVWALAVMRDITLAKRREKRISRQAMTDPLTALPNRTAMVEISLKEIKRAVRHNRPLTVVMADLDGFKEYNDAYGHLAGDDLLKSLAALLQAGRRAGDLVARYGGDEFAFLLPETDAAGAMVVAERLRYLVQAFPFPKGDNGGVACPRVTISMGVALFPKDGNTFQELLKRADKRLYQAKQLGRNRVVGSE
ncbi:MAG: sensor domain-containing diguanylate cyclase [Elusimicrobia bacterium]|nr:sensor domain-containing diguanylate cyclase [Elusimicrobiota bacterium]